MNKALFIFPLALTLASCSVLEDRGACPCWVRADVSCIDPIKTNEPFDGITLLFENDNGFSYSDEITCEDLDSSSVKTYTVPRALTDIVALSGNGDASVDGCLFLPMKECDVYPAFYSWHRRSDLLGEEATVKPLPHKQHCVIHIALTDMFRPENGDLYIRISGEVEGINLYTLRPVEGVFSVEMPVGTDGKADATVPRQYPWNNLTASVWRNGEKISDTNLSLLMKDAGYDWDKEDLDDISLAIENFYIEGKVEICPWDSVMEGDIII